MKYMIEVTIDGQKPKRHKITQHRVTIGRAPRAGITLPDAVELDDEHLLLTTHENGCHITLAQETSIGFIHDGQIFTQHLAAWGDKISIGKTQIRFIRQPKVSKLGPTILSGLIILTATTGGFLISRKQDGTLASPMPPAPALLDDVGTCLDKSVNAISRALELEQTAIAKAQRIAFDPYQGVEAVALLRMAYQCYKRGRKEDAAARVKEQIRRRHTHLNQLYKSHQVRLRLALDRKAYSHALQEARFLQTVLKGKNGPYVQWLASLVQELEP